MIQLIQLNIILQRIILISKRLPLVSSQNGQKHLRTEGFESDINDRLKELKKLKKNLIAMDYRILPILREIKSYVGFRRVGTCDEVTWRYLFKKEVLQLLSNILNLVCENL